MLEVMQVNGTTTFCDTRFEACQAAVGGYVEPVRLTNGDVLLVNEEGLLQGLPLNPGASLLARREIVGPAVFVPRKLVKRLLG